MIMARNNIPSPLETYIDYVGESIQLEDITKISGLVCDKNRRLLEIVVLTRQNCHIIRFSTLEEAQDQRVALTHYLESKNEQCT